ncbi:hypothetical protein AUP68_13770 [Ilyonectria robusta]
MASKPAIAVDPVLIPGICRPRPARLDPSVPLNPEDPFATPPVTPNHSRPASPFQQNPFATPPGSPNLHSFPLQSISSDRTARKVGIYGPSPLGPLSESHISLGTSFDGGTTAHQSLDTLSELPPPKARNSFDILDKLPIIPLNQSTEKLVESPAAKPKENLWSRFLRAANNQISIKEIWDLINPVEYLWPITLKKYLVLLLVAAICVGIFVSDLYTDWISKSMAITRSYMLPVLIIVIGLEPLMFLVILIAAKIPSVDDPDNQVQKAAHEVEKKRLSDIEALAVRNSTDDYDTAFVIPCHNSDRDALQKVFASAYPYFRPQDIFVVDNGRSRYPNDLSFRDWVKSQHPDINYIWSPIGSKNAAQMVGAMAAKDFRYILTTDDDVSLPVNYRHPTHMINDEVKAVAFALKGIDAKGDTPMFLVAWQDCEYRMAGLTKLAEASLCGVCFPHGAGWFVERETLVELLAEYHPIDFIAEDVNSGFSLMRMKKRIAFDAHVVLATEVPTTLLGPGLNWFKQRVKSWEMGRHGLLFKFIRRFFALNGQRTITGILVQKFVMLYSVASIIIDWVRVPIFVTMGSDASFWRTAVLLSLTAIFPIMLYNYVKCWNRPDLRVRFLAGLTYPVYKQLYAFVSVIGAIRCVLFYAGGHVKAKPIYQMVKEDNKACFWLDPKFETNPGWLADEKDDMIRKAEFTTSPPSTASSVQDLLFMNGRV